MASKSTSRREAHAVPTPGSLQGGVVTTGGFGGAGLSPLGVVLVLLEGAGAAVVWRAGVVVVAGRWCG